MAKVLLLSSVSKGDTTFPPFAREDLDRLRRCADKDVYKVHSIVDDPYEADLILFVERRHAVGKYLEHLRKNPILRQFWDKSLICNSRYTGVPFVPGIYGCVRRGDCLFPTRIKSGHYTEIYDKPHIAYDPQATERPYLYSFMGAVSTWPVVREPLSRLKHPRGLFVDTSKIKGEVQAEGKDSERNRYHGRYVDVINQSKFVLCPRGDAPASMRLFEAMKMGRVPVVISDEYVYPEGPRWDAFSVHVAEKDIASIPSLLESLEGRAEEMGELARQEYEKWFAEEVYFHHVVEWCLDIQRKRTKADALLQYAEYCKVLRPYQLRRFASAQYWKVVKRKETLHPAGAKV